MRGSPPRSSRRPRGWPAARGGGEAGRAPAVVEAAGGVADGGREGAGAVLLMEEFFASEDAGRLLEVLSRQPAWSNLPLLVLAPRTGHPSRAGTPLTSLP